MSNVNQAKDTYSLLLQHSIELYQHGFIVLDEQLRIRIANSKFAKWLGYDCHELINTSISHLHILNRKKEVIFTEQFFKHAKTCPIGVGDIEATVKTKSGSLLSIALEPIVRTISDNQYVYVTVKIQEWEANPTLLTEVLNKALSGIYIFDLELQKNIFINKQYTTLTGYTLNDLDVIQSEENMMDLFHPDDLESVNQHIESVVAHRDEYETLIYRFRHKDGHWIWCLSRDSVFAHDERGTPTKMLGSFVDITELKTLDLRIEQLSVEFATTFEQAGVGIAHVGLDGHFLEVNKKLCDILRYPREILLETDFQSLTYPEDLDQDLIMMNRLLAGEEQQYQMEKRYICRDGEVIWASLTGVIVKNQVGENKYFIAVVEDISHRKAAEQLMQESNLALERFAYSASHDLQEPLRKIISFSNSLLEKPFPEHIDTEITSDIERIHSASVRMRDMIESLLQLSRYSNSPLHKNPCSMKEIIEATRDNLSDSLNESGATIVVPQDITLMVDRFSFVRLFQNLFSNSIRFANASIPAIITVSAETFDQYIEICVSDNGQGFDNKKAEDLFAPFKRLVPRLNPGYGMGLTIVRQIVKKHDGFIFAESDGKSGAKFIIRLPTSHNEGN